MEARTLSDLVFELKSAVAARGPVIVGYAKGRQESLSTADFIGSIHSLTLALDGADLSKGDRVAIFADRRPERYVVDLACQVLGLPTVWLDADASRERAGFILRNSGARWVFFGGEQRRDLLLTLQGSLTSPLRAVAFEGAHTLPGGESLTRVMGRGAEMRGETPISRFRGRVEEADLASLIYTRGVAGDPRGVMLTHAHRVASLRTLGETHGLGTHDLALSLPSPVEALERAFDDACLGFGAVLHVCASGAELRQALEQVSPTVVAASAEAFVRIYRRVADEVKNDKGSRRRAFERASRASRQASDPGGAAEPEGPLRRALAARALGPLRRALGGETRLRIVMGAPPSLGLEAIYSAARVPLSPTYGLAEAAVVATASQGASPPGSVGKPVERVSVSLASDGEIRLRGTGVMDEYWDNPAATHAAVDEEGWFSTGDLGRLDANGSLFVEGRARDMLWVAGQRIVPRPLERQLAESPGIAEAVLVGDGQPYLGALIVAEPEALAERAGLGAAELEACRLVEHPQCLEWVESVIGKINAALPEPSMIRRFALLEQLPGVAEGKGAVAAARRQPFLERHPELARQLYPDGEERVRE